MENGLKKMHWCDWFEMDLSRFNPNDFWNILDAEEKERANRFKIESVAKSFVLCRGFLKTVLSRYLFLKPNQVKFEYGQFGKPFVKSDVEFNLSHSQNTCIIAVSNIKVGIDCEFMANKDFDKLSKRFFSKEEHYFISETKEIELKKELFYRSWCMRESMAKMTGEGLSKTLQNELIFNLNSMRIIKPTSCQNLNFKSLFLTEKNMYAVLCSEEILNPVYHYFNSFIHS